MLYFCPEQRPLYLRDGLYKTTWNMDINIYHTEFQYTQIGNDFQTKERIFLQIFTLTKNICSLRFYLSIQRFSYSITFFQVARECKTKISKLSPNFYLAGLIQPYYQPKSLPPIHPASRIVDLRSYRAIQLRYLEANSANF